AVYFGLVLGPDGEGRFENVDRDRYVGRAVVRRVVRGEGGGEQLPVAGVQDGPGRRRVTECAGQVGGGIELGRTERRAVNDRRWIGPVDREGRRLDGE